MELLLRPVTKQDLLDRVGDQFLDDVLHDRLARDRQHLLGLGLRRGKQPRAESGDRDDRALDHLLNIQPCNPPDSACIGRSEKAKEGRSLLP